MRLTAYQNIDETSPVWTSISEKPGNGGAGLNGQTMQFSLINSRIKLSSGLYEIVLIIFIEISAIANFWVDTFTHPPSKRLQQALSTKKFNDSAVVMLTMFVSRLWILSCSKSNPAFSFTQCLLFSLAFCHCVKTFKNRFVIYRVDFGTDFSNKAFSSFLQGSFQLSELSLTLLADNKE